MILDLLENDWRRESTSVCLGGPALSSPLQPQVAGIASVRGRPVAPDAITERALSALTKQGIRWARRGGAPEFPCERGRGFAFEPGADHPLLLPSTGDARPDWTLDDFVRAVLQARDGRIAILQFHGTPDTANTPRSNFEGYMKYLAINDYKVIALRDLNQYVDPTLMPVNANEIIETRKRLLAE
jgi:hypothetical protein